MVKVSVVVPTYNSGERIDSVVESLDRQSLPPHEFEAVIVDDGPADGTPHRLKRIAAERPYVRTAAIPNSGWPAARATSARTAPGPWSGPGSPRPSTRRWRSTARTSR